jgi:integrase
MARTQRRREPGIAGVGVLRCPVGEPATRATTGVAVLQRCGARGRGWFDPGTPSVLSRTKPTKTGHARSVRLPAALAADLADWRKVSGNQSDKALIFPRADGGAWTDTDFRNWRKRKFQPAALAAGAEIDRPYDLRHSAASLWLHEGINPVQVAQWMGIGRR